MYNLISAMAKPIGNHTKWISPSIGGLTLKRIFELYSQVYVLLFNTTLQEQVSVDLEHLRTSQVAVNLTLNDFLVSVGNGALPHMESTPSLKLSYARYADAFKAGYTIHPRHPTASLDSRLPLSEKTMAFLTKPDTDYAEFYKTCMVSVNGYFHLIDADVNGIYVKDAFKSLWHANKNQLGILCFRDIGTVEYKPITTDMVKRQLENIPLRTKTYLDLGEEIGNRIPMLVIGGYLHVLCEKTVYPVNDTTICVDFQNYPLIDRYYESKAFLDLDALDLEKTSRNDTQISVENIYSDEVLTRLLTLPQSFVVFLTPKSDIFMEDVLLENTTLPGMLMTELTPDMPLVHGLGRFLEYWSEYEDGKYSINVVNDVTDQRQYWRADLEVTPSVADHRIPTDRMRKSFARFVCIGSNLVL